MYKEVEQKLLELKDKFYNMEINDIEYRNGIKKIFGTCRVKILPSKMAQIFFPDETMLQVDDWNGVKWK